jgi:hypothetical protein
VQTYEQPALGWTVGLRRRPVRSADDRAQGGYTNTVEIICCARPSALVHPVHAMGLPHRLVSEGCLPDNPVASAGPRRAGLRPRRAARCRAPLNGTRQMSAPAGPGEHPAQPPERLWA